MKKNQRKAGVLLSYASQAVHILTGLIYTPIMLRLLGQSEYGLYQLVYSVVSYLGLLSLGFSASYMKFYSKFKSDNDNDGTARLNGMFMLVFSLISVLCMICGSVMIFNIKGIFGSGLSVDEYNTATILMILMVINLSLTFPNSVFNCIITANEEFIYQKVIVLLQGIINPFITLPILIAGYGSIGMVSVTTVITLLSFVSNFFFCKRKLKTKFSYKNLKFSLLKEMWVFTFFIFLNQIIDQINWSVDKFLLGRIMGTGAVAIYGVGAQINTLYIQFSTSVSAVFVPKVNMLVAEKKDNKLISQLFTKVGRVQFVIMMLVLSGFIFFGKQFIFFWTGSTYEEAYYVVLALIIPVTIPLIQNLGIEIQRAKNKHKARSIVYFFIAIGNILLSIPLIKLMGPLGAAIGTCISLFCGNIVFMNWYYHCKLDIDIKSFWKNIVSFIPSFILPVFCGIMMNLFVKHNTVLRLFIQITIYTFIYCLCVYFIGLNNEEKNMINKPLRKVFNKIRCWRKI